MMMIRATAFQTEKSAVAFVISQTPKRLRSVATPDPSRRSIANDDEMTRKSSGTTEILAQALKPKETVHQLDKFIIGQQEAKVAVAIAMRNRWRRQQLSEDLKKEVIPKNILMIGPTGCGKTEVARRIASLSQAPFIKVEATKFTEVGFVGKDVDSIIKDLVEIGITMTKKRLSKQIDESIAELVEKRLVKLILGEQSSYSKTEEEDCLKNLREKTLEDRSIEIDIPAFKHSNRNQGPLLDISNLSELVDELKLKEPHERRRSSRRYKKVSEARQIIYEEEREKRLEEFDVQKEAIKEVEQSGIVFIDEIDKVVNSGDHRSADASAEGVQRDLLPLIEGTTIATKHGNVNTDFILFIASGAFHSAKPSDLLAELQGRLPIRVSLKALTEEDFYRILTEPEANLIRQQIEMMKSEKVELIFTEEAIREIAKVAYEMNKTVENIGARRLHAIIEKVVEQISLEAPENPGKRIEVTAEYVRERVSEQLVATDLRKYII